MLTLSRKLQLLSAAAVWAMVAVPAHAAPIGASYVNDPAIPLWAGPYVGVHGGGTWADFTNQAPVAGPSGSASSFTGGPQVGYLWQSNRLVYGVEADWSYLDLSSNTPGVHFHEGWTATARGRLGYAAGPWLPYVTGGVAFTNTRFENTAGASTEEIQPGFTVGAGIEKYISPRISARAEFLYVDVPRDTQSPGGTVISGGSGNSTGRIGLNYHF